MRTLGRKAGQAGLVCGVVLFQVVIGVTLARSAEQGAAETAKETLKESGPFGGCEPIGLTASGELVFPLECKKLIKKPAEAPVAEDKSATEDRTASTDAAPSRPVQSAVADKPAPDIKPAASEAASVAQPTPAEPKQAAVIDKPENNPKTPQKASGLDPVAAPKAAAGKPSISKPGMSKPVASNPATSTSAPAKSPGSAVTASAAAGNAAPGKAGTSTPQPGKSSAGKPGKPVVIAVKDPAVRSAPTEAPAAASKPTAMSAIRKMIVMAKPANTGTPVAARPQAEDGPRLRTAGMPGCMQFRSYNPSTRSYRGFDGHIYACR
ncbi:hypothetical protein [Bradyrhizobium sp. ORS 285]|uniref:hypothetical protein n=1 Tax=Bradyrhizobium sp. ORS 285 TaxID=115808 RepID=UPI001FCB9B48|nr:hypothetical protein [Bradyrhizobium sp. ORS 285]